MLKIGIIGYGHYGKLLWKLIRHFCDEHDINVQVLVYEKNAELDGHKFFRLEDLYDCHAAVFAVDMDSFEQSVKDLLNVTGLRADMILVNVCSEQAKSGAVLAALAGEHPCIGFHTPWGPEAWRDKNQMPSLMPAAVVTKMKVTPQLAKELFTFVRKCGFRHVHMRDQEHDKKIPGRWMFIAHLICRLLEKLGAFDEDYSAAPLSYQYIMQGAQMLRNDTRLFFDLWKRVPTCLETFNAIVAAVRELVREKDVHANGK